VLWLHLGKERLCVSSRLVSGACRVLAHGKKDSGSLAGSEITAVSGWGSGPSALQTGW